MPGSDDVGGLVPGQLAVSQSHLSAVDAIVPVVPPGNLADSELLLKSTHLIYFRLGFALVSLVVSGFLGWMAGFDYQPIGVFYVAGFVVAYTLAGLLAIKRTDA